MRVGATTSARFSAFFFLGSLEMSLRRRSPQADDPYKNPNYVPKVPSYEGTLEGKIICAVPHNNKLLRAYPFDSRNRSGTDFVQNDPHGSLHVLRLTSATTASPGTELEEFTCDIRRSRGKIRSCLIG